MEIDQIPFSELLVEVVDNRGKTCPTSVTGFPLIATNCVRNDLLYPTYETVRYVSQETYDTWFRGHPKPGDLIFVTKGSPGRLCFAPNPVDFCIAQDMVAVRPDDTKVYPRYLFALLRSAAVQAQIEQMHVGTLIPHFKKGDFDKLLLPVPVRERQELIGDTYYELSAKIDLNRRMNDTLKAMTQALFKSWFVDFDPVRTKARGNVPNSHPKLAQPFPKYFQESEIGAIPQGWSIKSVYDTGIFINGVAFRSVHFSADGSGLPIVKIAELKDGITQQTKFTSDELPAKYRIRDGEILFSWSGSPDTSIDTFIWAGGDGWLNQHIFKVVFNRPEEGHFVYYLLKYLKPMFVEIARNKQTTGLGHVTAQDMKRLKVAFPPDAVLKAFQKTVDPIFRRSFQTLVESRTLTALRDALLTKLLSQNSFEGR